MDAIMAIDVKFVYLHGLYEHHEIQCLKFVANFELRQASKYAFSENFKLLDVRFNQT